MNMKKEVVVEIFNSWKLITDKPILATHSPKVITLLATHEKAYHPQTLKKSNGKTEVGGKEKIRRETTHLKETFQI